MATPAESADAPAQNTNVEASQPDNNQTATTTTTEAQPEKNVEVELELPSSAADGLIRKPFPKPLDTSKAPTPDPLSSDQ